MTVYSKDQLVATTGSILLAAATGEPAAAEQPAVDAGTAIISLPQHQDLELAAIAKLCYACAQPEARDLKLLKCSSCGVTYYCSSTCQKADWKVSWLTFGPAHHSCTVCFAWPQYSSPCTCCGPLWEWVCLALVADARDLLQQLLSMYTLTSRSGASGLITSTTLSAGLALGHAPRCMSLERCWIWHQLWWWF